MAYKLKIKHNLSSGVVLPVTLTYDDPELNLSPINISLKSSYATEYRLWDIDDLNVDKIKIVESNMVIGKITYKFDPKNITITEASSGGESGGESGGGSGGGSTPSGGGESGGGSTPSGGGESGGGSTPEQSQEIAITYNIQDDGIIVYSNGTYQTASGSTSGRLFSPPSRTHIDSVSVGENTYNMEEVTITEPKPTESNPNATITYTKTYAVIPNEVLSTTSHIYAVSANYSNNTEESVNIQTYDSTTTIIQDDNYDLVHDVQDGELRLYENGYYRIVGTNVIGNLIPEINNEERDHEFYRMGYSMLYYENNTEADNTTIENGFTSDNNESFPDLYGLRYVIIPNNLAEIKVRVHYPETNKYLYDKLIHQFDSAIHISFKQNVKNITIDRSVEASCNRQLPYGETLKDYIEVTISPNAIWAQNNDIDYSTNQLVFETNQYPSIFVREFNVSGEGLQYEFTDCNWKLNTPTTVYVKYRGHIYDNMVISIIQSDASKIYIRNVDVKRRTIYLNQTYTLRDFIEVYPSDAKFDDFIIGGFNSLGTDDFGFSGSSSYLTITKWNEDRYPETWTEFFDQYMTIVPIAKPSNRYGETRITYKWRTKSGMIGSGDTIVYIRDQQ